MPGGSKTFYLFDCVYENIGLKTEDLDTSALGVYLSNTDPVAATHTIYQASGGNNALGPLDLATKNGYTAAGEPLTNAYSQTAGTGTLVAGDDYVEWTATAADDATGIGPFRYAVLYDSDTNALIGWWDYGSAITILEGESFKDDFGASLFTLA